MKTSAHFLTILSCLSAFAVGGCASATFVPTRGAYPAKAITREVEVFSSALPDRAYEEMGIVEGEGSRWKADLFD